MGWVLFVIPEIEEAPQIEEGEEDEKSEELTAPFPRGPTDIFTTA